MKTRNNLLMALKRLFIELTSLPYISLGTSRIFASIVMVPVADGVANGKNAIIVKELMEVRGMLGHLHAHVWSPTQQASVCKVILCHRTANAM